MVTALCVAATVMCTVALLCVVVDSCRSWGSWAFYALLDTPGGLIRAIGWLVMVAIEANKE